MILNQKAIKINGHMLKGIEHEDVVRFEIPADNSILTYDSMTISIDVSSRLKWSLMEQGLMSVTPVTTNQVELSRTEEINKKLDAVERLFNSFNEMTPAQKKTFNSAIKRGPFFR